MDSRLKPLPLFTDFLWELRKHPLLPSVPKNRWPVLAPIAWPKLTKCGQLLKNVSFGHNLAKSCKFCMFGAVCRLMLQRWWCGNLEAAKHIDVSRSVSLAVPVREAFGSHFLDSTEIAKENRPSIPQPHYPVCLAASKKYGLKGCLPSLPRNQPFWPFPAFVLP